MDNKALKERVITKLKEKNLSVYAVEKLAGVGTGALRYFLTGRTKNPDLETLNAIAQVLKCDLADLLGLVPKSPQNQNTTYLIHQNIKVNYELYIDTVQFVSNQLQSHKIILTSDLFFTVLKEIYYHSLKMEKSKLDKEFASECLNSLLK